MFTVNLTEMRANRQVATCRNLAELMAYGEFDEKDISKLLNLKSLDRLCNLLGISRQNLYEKCQGDIDFALVVSHGCSKQASRQGTKDESFILSGLDKAVREYGVLIKQLKVDEIRPTLSGKILTKEEFKKSGLTRIECLKSLDGQMEGKISGWIFAKVVLGSGGHQDNVFHEAKQFGDWARKFAKSGYTNVILIDTDQQKSYNNLKSKFDSDSLWVVDHLEFQQRVKAYV